jgi:hypothetical protein
VLPAPEAGALSGLSYGDTAELDYKDGAASQSETRDQPYGIRYRRDPADGFCSISWAREQAGSERAACSGGGIMRGFLKPRILLAIAAAVCACASVWPNGT